MYSLEKATTLSNQWKDCLTWILSPKWRFQPVCIPGSRYAFWCQVSSTQTAWHCSAGPSQAASRCSAHLNKWLKWICASNSKTRRCDALFYALDQHHQQYCSLEHALQSISSVKKASTNALAVSRRSLQWRSLKIARCDFEILDWIAVNMQCIV